MSVKRVVAFFFIVGICIGVWFGIESKRRAELLDKIATLSVQVGPLEREVASLRQDLATCQGAQAGSEATLEDFYQELMFAHRFDMVVFDEDGQARRLVFDCGGNEQ